MGYLSAPPTAKLTESFMVGTVWTGIGCQGRSWSNCCREGKKAKDTHTQASLVAIALCATLCIFAKLVGKLKCERQITEC